MRSARPALYSIGVAAAALALLFSYQRVTAMEARARGLTQRLSLLESARTEPVEQLIRHQTRTQGSPSVQVDGPAEPPVAATARESQPASRFRTTEELNEAYEERFSAEPLDAPWAQEAERSYMAAIRQVLPASSEVLGFECRSRFCDLEVTHASAAASNAFLTELFAMEREGSLDKTSGGFHATPPEPISDGLVSLHVYIARRGRPLTLDAPIAEESEGKKEAN